MPQETFQAFLGSGYIDFFVAHPAAFLFWWAFRRGAPWARNVGLVSVTISLYSAYLVLYLQVIYGAQVFDLATIAITWVPFVPVVALFVALLRQVPGT